MIVARSNSAIVAFLTPASSGIPNEILTHPAAKALPKLMGRIMRERSVALVLEYEKNNRPSFASGSAATLGAHGLVGYHSIRTQAGETLHRQTVATILKSMRAPKNARQYGRGLARSSDERAYADAARAITRAFVRTLDPEILDALRYSRRLDSQDYNWVSINKERRIAALRSYPWLARTMIESRDVAVTIDVGGGSLEEAMLDATGWTRRSLRRVSRRPAALKLLLNRILAEGMGYSSTKPDNTLLESTPDHLLPSSRAQWVGWAESWAAVKSINTKLPAELQTKLFADTYGQKNWRDHLEAAIARRHADSGGAPVESASTKSKPDVSDLVSAVRDIDDALDSLLDNALIPAAIGTGEGGKRIMARNKTLKNDAKMALYRILASKGGLAPLLAVSSEWHRRGDRDQRLSVQERESLPDDTVVGHIFATDLALGSLVFHPRTTAGAIRAEAKAMDNCLWRYVDRALNGSILVFHVSGTHKGKKIKASMTLRRNEDGKKLVVDDIRNAKDRPFVDCKEIAQVLADYANGRELEVRTDAEAAKKLNLTRGLEGMFDMPEIAVERAESSWASWSYLLPKRLRTHTVWEALEGPFFDVGRLLCRKGWMSEKRKSQAALARARKAAVRRQAGDHRLAA